MAGMAPGEAAHHRALAPTVVHGIDGQVTMQAFDPEGEVPYSYDVAGRQDYGAVRVQGGDRDAFYDWLEGSSSVSAQLQQLQIDPSKQQQQLEQPPPRRKHFPYTPDGRLQFRQARAICGITSGQAHT